MLNLRSLLVAGALLVGGQVSANDLEALMGVAKDVWPEKTHLAVVCNYRDSATRDQVQDLALAAGSGRHITVFDIPHGGHVGGAACLVPRYNSDFLVLLPRDRAVHDGSMEASMLIARMTRHGKAVLGTTRAAFRQGAAFVLGPNTGGELLVNTRLQGIIDVILPDRARIYSHQAGLAPFGCATVTVCSAR